MPRAASGRQDVQASTRSARARRAVSRSAGRQRFCYPSSRGRGPPRPGGRPRCRAQSASPPGRAAEPVRSPRISVPEGTSRSGAIADGSTSLLLGTSPGRLPTVPRRQAADRALALSTRTDSRCSPLREASEHAEDSSGDAQRRGYAPAPAVDSKHVGLKTPQARPRSGPGFAPVAAVRPGLWCARRR